MKYDDERAASGDRNGASGPLERVSFGSHESGEKSLLELIEERTDEKSSDNPSPQGDLSFSDWVDGIDDAGPNADQILIRLGGNGF